MSGKIKIAFIKHLELVTAGIEKVIPGYKTAIPTKTAQEV